MTTTVTTTGGGGMGGQGGAGTGAGLPDLQCETDGRCESSEHCACPDCWYSGDVPNCLSTANCLDDGVCDASSDNNRREGCHCPDCADRPECSEYCISCQTKLVFNPDATSLCADSAVIFGALETAVCDNTLCVTECGGNFCNGNFPSQPCLDCINDSYATERDACLADIKTRNRCNPMTGAPCNTVGGERCDRRIHGGEVVGFECFLQNASANTCEACTYAIGSTTHCRQGGTCVDGTDSPAATGTCGAYCCEDTDCSGTATCVKGAFAPAAPGLGTCSLAAPADPECTPPADPPSMGSCVTVGTL